MKRKMLMAILPIINIILFLSTIENLEAKSSKEKNDDPIRTKMLSNPPSASTTRPTFDSSKMSGKISAPAATITPASALPKTNLAKPLAVSVPTANKLGQGGNAHSSKHNYNSKKSRHSSSKSSAPKSATTYGQNKTDEKHDPAQKTSEKSEKTSARPVKSEGKSKIKMRIVAPGEE